MMGYPNVDRMLQEITSEQLNEWMAFYQLEPFGFQADLYGDAITASTIYNVNRGKSRALTPQDFLPVEKEEREPTASEFIANLKRFFGHNNGNQRTPDKTRT